MSACYSCNAILNKKNQSAEHIIPNSIGGILKSYRLLCRQCNSAYGMTIDAALAKEFEAHIATLNVERDRPKPNTTRNPDKPTIRLDKNELFISGHGKQVVQIVAGLTRKFPYIDLNKELLNDSASVEQDITINLPVGSDLFLRSVAKIAVNYYLMKTRGRHHLDTIINVIDGVEENNDHIHHHPLPPGIWNEGEISHLVIIKGNASLKQLHAHVILFNVYSFVVRLSDAYNGPDVQYSYRYDIVRGEEIKTEIILNYDKNTP